MQPPSKGTESPEDHDKFPQKGLNSDPFELEGEGHLPTKKRAKKTKQPQTVAAVPGINLPLGDAGGGEVNEESAATAAGEDEKLTTAKVVKPRATKKSNSTSAASTTSVGISAEDLSFSSLTASQIAETAGSNISSSDEDTIACNEAIQMFSASQIFIFFRDRKLSQLQDESLLLLKAKLNKETDPDDANILLKAIKLFGKSCTNLYCF